jgi:hypothetical protein
MPKQSKQYSLHGLAGLVQQSKSRVTGTTISIYHSEQAGYDSSEGMVWSLVCEEHGEILGSHSLAHAKYHAGSPISWCESCQNSHKR